MLLHISDIHARPGQALMNLADEIAMAVASFQRPTYLVASGDFGFRGLHVALGARFVRLLADRIRLSSDDILCCPGNHDIGSEAAGIPSLSSYHGEIARLLRDATRAEPRPAQVYRRGDYEFLLLNSAHLLDWQKGHVDMRALQGLPISDAAIKIAIVHHHCIPFEEADRSHISNAYPLLTYLVNRGYVALLHGHRHLAMTLRVSALRVIGVGSINYEPTANVNNQFNLLSPGQFIRRFRFVADAASKAGPDGTWVSTEEPW
jgi:hypothetical protein